MSITRNVSVAFALSLIYGAVFSVEAVMAEYPEIILQDGGIMPQVGIGVYRCDPGDETVKTVTWALEFGVRMIDTAAMYENEASVHDAWVNSGLPRDQVFVTSKLDTDDHGYDAAYEAAKTALEETLQMSYMDLFLIHSPFGGKIVETWDALVDLQSEGLVHSIGVSNFGIPHLEAIRRAGRPMPVVNQIEMHPLIYQRRKKLVDYCQLHGIAIVAYGSLFSGWDNLYDNPTLNTIATRTGKSIPQILLRWALDHGFVIIPKSSSSKERQQENYNILDFQLTPEELNELDHFKSDVEFDEYWDPVDEAEVDVGIFDLADPKRTIDEFWDNYPLDEDEVDVGYLEDSTDQEDTEFDEDHGDDDEKGDEDKAEF